MYTLKNGMQTEFSPVITEESVIDSADTCCSIGIQTEDRDLAQACTEETILETVGFTWMSEVDSDTGICSRTFEAIEVTKLPIAGTEIDRKVLG